MAILDILEYPNPILRKPCERLTPEDLASDRVQQLIADMVETMYHHEGSVGLAASQVGASVQLFVMDSTAKTTRDRLKILANPVILQQSQWKYSREGCLSFPDYLVTVKRARKVSATWLDATKIEQEEIFLDFEAIIFQHEQDHLNGILFIDRVKNLETDLILRNTEASADSAMPS